MLADAFAQPVRVLEAEEGPAHGAALLAGVGAGVWPSVADACDAAIAVGGQTDPNPDAADLYRELQTEHGALYADLRERFASLASR